VRIGKHREERNQYLFSPFDYERRWTSSSIVKQEVGEDREYYDKW